MIGFIYLWTNKINDKKYIGLHIGKETDNYIGSGVIFKKAIKKYGIENFERSILYREYETQENLYKKEFELINHYNAVFSDEFYNMTNYDPKYVKFIDGRKIRILSDETKEKIRKIRLGSVASPETKLKMSLSQKGKPSEKKGKKGFTIGKLNGQFGKRWYNNGITDMTYKENSQPVGWILGRLRGIFIGKDNPFYGRTHSEETKQKISIKLKNNRRIKSESIALN